MYEFIPETKFTVINETINVKDSKPYNLQLEVADNGVVVDNDSGTKIA